MKENEVMSRKVFVANAEGAVQGAARKMAGSNSGVLPVAESDRLVGMPTDRDIVVKGIARGKGPDAEVRDVMTPEVKYCFDDREIDDVMRNMGDLQVRRLPVLNRDKSLIGILSLGDAAVSGDKGKTVEALHGISRPGGDHGRVAAGGDRPL